MQRGFQLLVAAVILIVAVVMLWSVDTAMTRQYFVLDGCWPETMLLDSRPVRTETFWLEQVQQLRLTSASEFFYTRVNHRILFYLMVLCAVVGWAGSAFLKIVRGATGGDTWATFVASFFLSGIAGALLFLLMISSRLSIDPGGNACISIGYAYLAAAGGIGAGLFVVAFFGWFEGIATRIFGILSGFGKKDDDSKGTPP